MKNFIVLAVVTFAAIGFSAQGVAADEHEGHGGHGAMSAQHNAESPLAEGLVKKVDKPARKVTVAHGPLANLQMPAMTMVFRVKDAAWLDQMRVDSKILFQADSINGVFTIVRFEPAK